MSFHFQGCIFARNIKKRVISKKRNVRTTKIMLVKRAVIRSAQAQCHYHGIRERKIPLKDLAVNLHYRKMRVTAKKF